MTTLTTQTLDPTMLAETPLERMAALMPWAISIVFHIGLLLILMFFLAMRIPKELPAAIPVYDISGTIQTPSASVEGPRVEDKKESPAAAKKATPEFDAPIILGTTSRTSSILQIDVPGDGDSRGISDIPAPAGPSGGGGGKGSPPVIFVPTQAQRIVFLVDSSGSMFTNFDYVREEMVRFIQELRPNQKFHVIFFADGRPNEFKVGGAARLLPAHPSVEKQAVRFIRDQIAQNNAGGGETRPEQGIEMAFKVAGGPPQVIYLLTDGAFNRRVVAQIDKLNPRREVTVHTISYVDRTGAELLKEIATRNHGNYRHVSEDDLARGR